MKAKSVINTSDWNVTLRLVDGSTVCLKPNESINDVKILNEAEIRGSVRIVHDLTEVGHGF